MNKPNKSEIDKNKRFDSRGIQTQFRALSRNYYNT